MKKLCVLLLAIGFIGLSDYSNGGVIQNGEFTVDLTDWDTDTTLFDAPIGISEVALFVEPTTGAGVQLAQTFILPTNALKLSFEYNLKASGGSVVGAVPTIFRQRYLRAQAIRFSQATVRSCVVPRVLQCRQHWGFFF